MVHIFNKVTINHIVVFNHISTEQVQENLEMRSYVNYILNQRDHRVVYFHSQTCQYWRTWEKRHVEMLREIERCLEMYNKIFQNKYD